VTHSSLTVHQPRRHVGQAHPPFLLAHTSRSALPRTDLPLLAGGPYTR
jgi:hypothetical protein